MKYSEEQREKMAKQLRQWWEDRSRNDTWGMKFEKKFIDERLDHFHTLFDGLQKEEQDNERSA